MFFFFNKNERIIIASNAYWFHLLFFFAKFISVIIFSAFLVQLFTFSIHQQIKPISNYIRKHFWICSLPFFLYSYPRDNMYFVLIQRVRREKKTITRTKAITGVLLKREDLKRYQSGNAFMYKMFSTKRSKNQICANKKHC